MKIKISKVKLGFNLVMLGFCISIMISLVRGYLIISEAALGVLSFVVLGLLTLISTILSMALLFYLKPT
jgi:hypothetical protein